MSLEGLSSGVWPVDDGLQPLEPLEWSGPVDAVIRRIGLGGANRCGDDRQFGGQSTPRFGRRKRGAAIQAIGRSRGGRTTKIHAIVDGACRPLAFCLSGGNVADITVAPALLATAPLSRSFLADQGYDARAFREQIVERGAIVVIPNNPTRKHPHSFDPLPYRQRNVIERMFCQLKDWRRIATRYDKLARNFASAVALAAAMTWWIN